MPCLESGDRRQFHVVCHVIGEKIMGWPLKVGGHPRWASLYSIDLSRASFVRRRDAVHYVAPSPDQCHRPPRLWRCILIPRGEREREGDRKNN